MPFDFLMEMQMEHSLKKMCAFLDPNFQMHSIEIEGCDVLLILLTTAKSSTVSSGSPFFFSTVNHTVKDGIHLCNLNRFA